MQHFQQIIGSLPKGLLSRYFLTLLIALLLITGSTAVPNAKMAPVITVAFDDETGLRFLQVFVTFDESLWDNKHIGIFAVMRSLQSNWQFAFRILRPPANKSVPFTSPANEEFATDGQPNECAMKFSNLKRLDLELELTPNSVLVRGANSVRHHFPAPLSAYGRLQIFFVATSIDEEGEDWCWLPMEIVQKATSKYNIPSTATPPSLSFAAVATNPHHHLQKVSVTTPYRRKKQKLHLSSRRSTLSTRSLFGGEVEITTHSAYTTAKIRPHRTETTSTSKNLTLANTFIDILNDRNHFENVQRSRTREVNSAWRWPFRFYFVLNYVIVVALVFFAVTMLVLLQIRPKQDAVTRVHKRF